MCYASSLINAYWVLKDKREVSNTALSSGFIMNILKWFPLNWLCWSFAYCCHFEKCDGLEISRLVCLIMACLTWFVKGVVRSWSKSEEFQRKRVFMKMVIYYFETYVNINENKKFSKTDCAWLLQKIIRNLERLFNFKRLVR